MDFIILQDYLSTEDLNILNDFDDLFLEGADYKPSTINIRQEFLKVDVKKLKYLKNIFLLESILNNDEKIFLNKVTPEDLKAICSEGNMVFKKIHENVIKEYLEGNTSFSILQDALLELKQKCSISEYDIKLARYYNLMNNPYKITHTAFLMSLKSEAEKLIFISPQTIQRIETKEKNNKRDSVLNEINEILLESKSGIILSLFHNKLYTKTPEDFYKALFRDTDHAAHLSKMTERKLDELYFLSNRIRKEFLIFNSGNKNIDDAFVGENTISNMNYNTKLNKKINSLFGLNTFNLNVFLIKSLMKEETLSFILNKKQSSIFRQA